MRFNSNLSGVIATPTSKFSKSAAVVLSLALMTGLSACSSLQSAENKVQSSVDIEVKALNSSEKERGDLNEDQQKAAEYQLSRLIDAPVKNLDNRAMHLKAKQLCEEGYVKLSQQAISSDMIKDTDLGCVSGGCQVQMNWHIRCQKVPEKPFTLFGKS